MTWTWVDINTAGKDSSNKNSRTSTTRRSYNYYWNSACVGESLSKSSQNTHIPLSGAARHFKEVDYQLTWSVSIIPSRVLIASKASGFGVRRDHGNDELKRSDMHIGLSRVIPKAWRLNISLFWRIKSRYLSPEKATRWQWHNDYHSCHAVIF